jgi:hypothetical protein
MGGLYRLRGERRAMSTAEALRQPQLAMLGGGLQAWSEGTGLRHPHIGACCVLMGSWW